MVDVDTRLLRAFVATAEELSFTRAAERLHLTQQALSAQVRQLEGRLRARLFERTTRRVALTTAGEALLPHARAALDCWEQGVRAAGDAERAEVGALRVGLSTTAVVELTGEVLRRFAEAFPDIALTVRNSPFGEPTGGLADGESDVAFVRPPFRAEGLSMATVLTEPRLAVLPASHSLAGRAQIAPEELVDEPWVWVRATDEVAAAFWTLDDLRGGRPLRIGAEITSFDEYFSVVSAGLAVGVCPASAAAALGAGFPRVRFVAMPGLEPATVAVAWRTAKEPAAVRAFVRVALQVAGETAAERPPAV